MYRELLREQIKKVDWAKLQDPCPENDIAEAEKIVGYTFPDDLKALLMKQTETTGFYCLQKR